MSETKVPISVVVITKNEEDNIADCLKSVSWADELIVQIGRASCRERVSSPV